MRPIVAGEISPLEPWLDATPAQTSLSGILDAVQLAQGLLLLEITGNQPPNRRRICLIVQHVSCSTLHWSGPTLRLAHVLGVALAHQPKDEPNAALHREIYALDGTYAEARSVLGANGTIRAR